MKRTATIPFRFYFAGILFILAIVKAMDVFSIEALSNYNSGLPTQAQTEYLQDEVSFQSQEIVDLYETNKRVKKTFPPTAVSVFYPAKSYFPIIQNFLKQKTRIGFNVSVLPHPAKFNIPHLNLDLEDPLVLSS